MSDDLKARLIESLSDMVQQHCSRDGDWYFAGFLSSNSEAMRVLEEAGIVELNEAGRASSCKFLK